MFRVPTYLVQILDLTKIQNEHLTHRIMSFFIFEWKGDCKHIIITDNILLLECVQKSGDELKKTSFSLCIVPSEPCIMTKKGHVFLNNENFEKIYYIPEQIWKKKFTYEQNCVSKFKPNSCHNLGTIQKEFSWQALVAITLFDSLSFS